MPEDPGYVLVMVLGVVATTLGAFLTLWLESRATDAERQGREELARGSMRRAFFTACITLGMAVVMATSSWLRSMAGTE